MPRALHRAARGVHPAAGCSQPAVHESTVSGNRRHRVVTCNLEESSCSEAPPGGGFPVPRIHPMPEWGAPHPTRDPLQWCSLNCPPTFH